MSYEAEKKLEQLITNETDPSISTIDILASLKAISYFESQIEDKPDLASSKIAQSELKWLNLAMENLGKNDALNARFGNGFQGAMALSSLLKSRHSERVTQDIFDKILKTKDETDPNVTVGRINPSALGVVQGGEANRSV